MHRWRYPSLSLHGIEGAFADGGAKTVIPRKVIGKFSIRLVPDMDPKVVEKQVAFEMSNIHCLIKCMFFLLILSSGFMPMNTTLPKLWFGRCRI